MLILRSGYLSLIAHVSAGEVTLMLLGLDGIRVGVSMRDGLWVPSTSHAGRDRLVVPLGKIPSEALDLMVQWAWVGMRAPEVLAAADAFAADPALMDAILVMGS